VKVPSVPKNWLAGMVTNVTALVVTVKGIAAVPSAKETEPVVDRSEVMYNIMELPPAPAPATWSI